MKFLKTFEDFQVEEQSPDQEKILAGFLWKQSRDPFDFFRVSRAALSYAPRTQHGLRLAFQEDLIPIEYYLLKATSVQPLIEVVLDIDDLVNSFALEKLIENPSAVSMRIMRQLLKNRDPEIAMYAAEGLNAVESKFVESIQFLLAEFKAKRSRELIEYLLVSRLKAKPEDANPLEKNLKELKLRKSRDEKNKRYMKKKNEILFFTRISGFFEVYRQDELINNDIADAYVIFMLAKMNYRFSMLMEAEVEIQDFYLQEALHYGMLGFNNYFVKNSIFIQMVGDIYLALKEFEKAEKYFNLILSQNPDNVDALFSLAEIYFLKQEIRKLVRIGSRISLLQGVISPYRQKILNYWIEFWK